MKVILIEEPRFKEICEKLKHENESLISKEIDPLKKQGMAAAHSNIHFYLVSWMQSHGASCV